MNFHSLISRLFAVLFAVVLLLSMTGDAEAKKRKKTSKKRPQIVRVLGVNDPRYAAIILDPVTGEIYHQQNASLQRYPASLTKMMTLYLLFEALEQGKISMSTQMEASELAARQPRTNLSMQAGDTVEVETAIKSLVVLSANDVSVVVAEKLAGSVENFADRMTAKARALGMKNTVFQNPNGLPNTAQYTTARDMAKLGIALKRDFPGYYRYFSTLQFSHQGTTYYTHNRVMLRYAGVDGIKTGFINASGFNLVTSVVRGGRPLVGVVMGGASGRWRDNRMIELLDQSYLTISQRGAGKRSKVVPENLPLLHKGAVKKNVGIDGKIAAATPDIPLNVPAAAPPEEAPPMEQEMPSESIVQAAAPVVDAPVVVAPEAPEAGPAGEASAPSPFEVIAAAETMPAPSEPADEVKKGFEWGIQIGAFSSEPLATQALKRAQRLAARQLVGAKPAVMGPEKRGGKRVYRARLTHISQTQARNACVTLLKSNAPCYAFQMGK